MHALCLLQVDERTQARGELGLARAEQLVLGVHGGAPAHGLARGHLHGAVLGPQRGRLRRQPPPPAQRDRERCSESEYSSRFRFPSSITQPPPIRQTKYRSKTISIINSERT